MFQVFGRFNLLMSRTRVQSAVREFQMRLIATVTQSIQKLQSKFTSKFESSAASNFSRMRGVPPITGKIIWARLIERQVRTLMTRMGQVLGSNWGQHLEGRQLRKSCDDLLGKLDSRAYVRAWLSEWEIYIIS
jgi:dynein heavy chain 1